MHYNKEEMEAYRRQNRSSVVFFLILYLSSSYVVTNDVISSELTTVVWVLSLVLALFLPSKSSNVKAIAPFMLLLIFFILSSIKNDEPIRALYLHLFTFSTAFVYLYKVGFNMFKETYIKVMFYICVISLFFYPLYLIIPPLNSINTVTNAAGNTASNLYLYVSLHPGLRNCGLFWEPGAFQTFISIALLFEVFNPLRDKRKIMVFVLTVLTTFSTTGFAALALIFAIYILSSSKTNNKYSTFFIVLLSVGVFVYFTYDLLFDSSGSIGKLIAFQERGGADSDTFDTVSVRYFSFVLPVHAFLSSPLLGVGYDGLINYTYEFTRGMNTCTMINWFAVYGIFWGGIMLIGIIRLSKYLGDNEASRLLITIFFFIITCSENYVNNPIFIILVLYGYLLSSNQKKSVNRVAI